MFLHLGGNFIVNKKDIVAIMDLESSSISKITKQYLKEMELNKNVINVEENILPKSYVILKNDKENKLYISPIAAQTLLKRCEEDYIKRKNNL